MTDRLGRAETTLGVCELPKSGMVSRSSLTFILHGSRLKLTRSLTACGKAETSLGGCDLPKGGLKHVFFQVFRHTHRVHAKN
jgi:hypothetical protein